MFLMLFMTTQSVMVVYESKRNIIEDRTGPERSINMREEIKEGQQA